MKESNLLKCSFSSFSDERLVYHVMEYLPGGDLFDMLAAIGPLPEAIVKKYSAQLILAVEFLHSKGILHNDIKLENLILDNIDDLGNCLLPYNDNWLSYCKLKEFFVRERDPFVLLEKIVADKGEIYTIAKAKLAIIGYDYCIFRLYDRFEQYFGKYPSNENRNILFQLKCFL